MDSVDLSDRKERLRILDQCSKTEQDTPKVMRSVRKMSVYLQATVAHFEVC